MRPVRFSIAGLMGVVLLVATGLAALRSASETWASVLFLATLVAFCIALVGAFGDAGARRGAWLGFAVFGWVYVGAAFEPYDFAPNLPTDTLLKVLAPSFGVDSRLLAGPFGRTWMQGAGFGRGAGVIGAKSFFQIGHCLIALLAGVIGALSGGWLFRVAAKRRESTAPAGALTGTADSHPPKWRLALLVCVLSSAVVATAIFRAGAAAPEALWGGSAFLLTWWFIGLFGLFGLFARGQGRAALLGATIFGASFMLLAFGRYATDPWPQLPFPTVGLLDEIRPWLPPVANGLRARPNSTTALNAQIHEALDRRASLDFEKETTLENVLKSIQQVTAGPDGKVIPIYVESIGPPTYTMGLTVRNISFEGVPVRTTLKVCLQQHGLAYTVKDGYVWISQKESIDVSLRSRLADTYQITGHCVLAMIAAGLGGLTGVLVWKPARRPSV